VNSKKNNAISNFAIFSNLFPHSALIFTTLVATDTTVAAIDDDDDDDDNNNNNNNNIKRLVILQSGLLNYNSTTRRKLCDITRNIFSDSSHLAPKYTSLSLRMVQVAL
jgi:hypothetical protein